MSNDQASLDVAAEVAKLSPLVKKYITDSFIADIVKHSISSSDEADIDNEENAKRIVYDSVRVPPKFRITALHSDGSETFVTEICPKLE